MTAPRYVDADLYRMSCGKTGALLELELDVSAVDVDDCRCFGKDPDARGCSVPYTFADGAVKLSCTNGDRVCEVLLNEGYSSTGDDLDRELLARLDRAAERERVAIAKSEQAADETLAGIGSRLERQQEALLKASRILAEEFPPQAIAAAGRALRGASHAR